MSTFTLRFRDEEHLRAHLADFAVSLDTALDWAREQLASRPHVGWAHFDFEAPQVVGRTGLVDVASIPGKDFWGRRLGRALPSHLVVGPKALTKSLCVWGFWESENDFVLHTMYPGKVAPREIHDPELPLHDLPSSLKFWSAHAIVVAPGEWTE